MQLPNDSRFLAGNRFELIEELGAGASGCIYRAIDYLLLDRELAIKLIREDWMTSHEAFDQVKAEIITARAVVHPNVVRVYELYENGGQPFITMELVAGEPLSRSIDSTRKAAALDAILWQLAEALAAVHRAGIVHCDVKPSNILVRPDGALKLTDFGVAALHAARIEWRGRCTPRYAAPELYQGEPPTPAADVYSFGLVALQLLTGVTDLAAAKFPVGCRLAPLIQRCLENEPAERYANGSQLLEALHPTGRRVFNPKRAAWPVAVAAAVAFAWAVAAGEASRHVAPDNVRTRSGAMRQIRGGTFRMGYAQGRASERPEHRVQLHDFYLDKYEVTAARFNALMPRQLRNRDARTPAMHISWYEADRYCRMAGQRLPTEAEWEFAARGAAGSLYPWGDEWREGAANVQVERLAFARIQPVGSFSRDRSASGIYDLLGNAPEWVADDYLPYPGADATGWPSGRKTVRGAGITYSKDETRLTIRDSAPPNRTGLIGFRCAADAAPID